MAQHYRNINTINNYQERVNQLAREIFIASGGKMFASESFTYAERFIEELSRREAASKKELQDALSQAYLPKYSKKEVPGV